MDDAAIVPVWVSPLLAAIVVAAAAGFAWSAARPVLREPAGAALPERLQVWRGQQRFALAFAIALLVFSGWHALWSIPVVWLALQVIVHRVRRQAYGDTWTFAGQLAWTLRAYLGTVAFWWIAALAPLALLAFDAPVPFVVAAGLTLAAWNHFYGDVFLALLRATPLARPDLDAVFEPVLARARVRRPRLMRAGPPGAQLANAFAFSHPRGDVVLFLDTLLAHATPAEAAGILAHEVGHLEDFATRRGRLYAHGALLAAGVPVVTLALRAAADRGVTQAGLAVWAGVVLGSLILRSRDSQQRERDSDRRAVELCGGDGDALVGGLLLLRSLALAPRRLDPARERQATHPSLARRIRAIRAASGLPPELLDPRAIRGAEPTRAVVFEQERLVFVTSPQPVDVTTPDTALAGASAVDAAAYAELVDLRTEPSRAGGVILVAADRHGRTRRLRIAAADAPALDALLDRADQRLSGEAPPPKASTPLDRLVAAVAALTVLAAGAWTLVFAALVACIVPTTAGLAALAAGAGVAAMRPGSMPRTARLVLALVGAVGAVAALRRGHTMRRTDEPFAWGGVLPASLAAAFAALWPTWFIVALGRADAVDLHVAARAWVSAAAGWASLGALFLLLPRRLGKLAGAAALALAAAIGAIASDAFRDRYAPDPLIAPGAPALVFQDLPATAVARLTIPGTHWGIALAPDARHVLLRGQANSERLPRFPFTIAGFDGWHREIEARDAAFVDASTLIVLRDEGTTGALTAESIRDGGVRWTLRVPDVPDGDLEVGPDGRWRLWDDRSAAGSDGTPRQVIDGRVGEATMARGQGPMSARLEFTGQQHAAGLLIPELTWRSAIALTGPTGPRPLVRTRLTVQCFTAFLTSPRAPCLASTADETFAWTVDVERGTLQPVARAPGPFVGAGVGNRAGLVWHGRQLLLLRAGSPRALRISSGERCPCPHSAAVAGGRIATLTSARGRSTVVLHEAR